MIACDGIRGGSFHVKCVNYDEAEAIGEQEWFCPYCDQLEEHDRNNYDELALIEHHNVHSSSVEGLLRAVKGSLDEIDRSAVEAGFDSRLEFLRKIIDCNGRNDYDMHHRGAKKRAANAASALIDLEEDGGVDLAAEAPQVRQSQGARLNQKRRKKK